MKNILIIISFAFIVSSCYYDSSENLNPQLPSEDGTSVCDTTNVTYTTTIQPILSSSCTSCHGDRSNYPLNTFKSAKSENEKTIAKISDGSMPQNAARLSACKINKFKAWKNQEYK